MRAKSVTFVAIGVLVLTAFVAPIQALETQRPTAEVKLGRTTTGGMDSYDYVVVTTEDLEDAVTPLVEWKDSLGYSPKVVITSWISSNYQGDDLQEQIRNFLKDNYKDWGIDYVLIAGSRKIIPMRMCAPNPFNHSDSRCIPSDYYYADLTGEWDSDGDGYYGEYMDDDADLYPEVYVGRLPSDSPGTVERICQRTTDFESGNGAWKHRALLMGSVIYYANYTTDRGRTMPREDAAVVMEECRTDILEPHGIEATTLYEKEGIRPAEFPCDIPLNWSNVLAEWQDGYALVNIFAHASNSGCAQLIWHTDDGDGIPDHDELRTNVIITKYDSDELGMDTPPIVFSGGCKQLATYSNMGESFMEDGAATAFIGGTSWTWLNVTGPWQDEKDGGVGSIDYYFFHNLVDRGQKCGNALYNAKAYYKDHLDFPISGENRSLRLRYFYENIYGFNLYGDPSLGLTTEKTDSNPPAVQIERPRGHLYLFGNEIGATPFGGTIVIGDIAVDIDASDEATAIEQVDIYLDGTLQETCTEPPYEWLCDLSLMGQHTLTVVAEDSTGNIAGDEIRLWMFNP